jgi:uncharacterized protein YndB with AHSA1/START domain
MVSARLEEVLRYPVETVFDAAADPFKQLEWDAGMLKSVEALTPGPLGKGSRYRGNFKQMGVVEYEYAQFDRPHRFEHRAENRMGRSWHIFSFEAVPSGTRLTQEGGIDPKGLWRLMAPMMTVMLRKRFAKIARELDAYLSRATVPPTT